MARRPTDWLQIERNGHVLGFIMQQQAHGDHRRSPGPQQDPHHDTGHRHGGSPWPEKPWPDQDIHETVQRAVHETLDAVDTVFDVFNDTFGEGFLFGRNRPRTSTSWEDGPGYDERHWGTGQFVVNVGLPASLETPSVSAHLHKGDARVADLWGTLSLRTGMGSLEIASLWP